MQEEKDTLCLRAQQWHNQWKQHQHHGWGASARPYVVAEDADGEVLFCLRDERGRLVHEGECEFSP
ncbi:MAG: hypothetical protein NVSMB65_06860 [Chloroflexota bacterium]